MGLVAGHTYDSMTDSELEREILKAFGDRAYMDPDDPGSCGFAYSDDAEDDARRLINFLRIIEKLTHRAYLIAAEYGANACSRVDDLLSDISIKTHNEATGTPEPPPVKAVIAKSPETLIAGLSAAGVQQNYVRGLPPAKIGG